MTKSSKAGILSMCRKAGKLVMGMDIVKDACRSGKAAAVFAAEDLSEKSLKEVKFVCGSCQVPLYALAEDMDSIAQGTGKRSGIIAVTDSGFAKAIKKGLEEISTDI